MRTFLQHFDGSVVYNYVKITILCFLEQLYEDINTRYYQASMWHLFVCLYEAGLTFSDV